MDAQLRRVCSFSGVQPYFKSESYGGRWELASAIGLVSCLLDGIGSHVLDGGIHVRCSLSLTHFLLVSIFRVLAKLPSTLDGGSTLRQWAIMTWNSRRTRLRGCTRSALADSPTTLFTGARKRSWSRATTLRMTTPCRTLSESVI